MNIETQQKFKKILVDIGLITVNIIIKLCIILPMMYYGIAYAYWKLDNGRYNFWEAFGLLTLTLCALELYPTVDKWIYKTQKKYR